MIIENIDIELEEIKKTKGRETNVVEDFLIDIYRLLDNNENYNLCVKAICHIANLHLEDAMVQQLLHDCIIKSRIFLYDDMLENSEIGYNPSVSPQDIFLKAFYTSSVSETTLTKPQKEIFNEFQTNRRLIVSAPTSFGKTRIIREIISHNDYKMIVIIMPTVSLLSESYNDFKQEFSDRYIVSKSSKIKIEEEKEYILILTPERMSVLMQDNVHMNVDFFVMDEIYKADYKLNDDRFRVFADILYRLTRSGADLYLIGPYISEFSEGFRNKFSIKMLKFDIEIVQKDYYELDYINQRGIHNIEGATIRVVGDKYKNLKRIIGNESIDGKYLIYRYRKQYVEDLAERLLGELQEKKHNESLVEYLESNISKNWSLVKCLKKGIAFHHGAMPRHIQDLIIDEFNKSSGEGVNYLFCTTSLTEGVNSTAKNVVLYDLKIGNGEEIKSLDRKNIEGRAGRFMQHFLGRVFYFEQIEKSENQNTNVEIEFIDSGDPKLETLVQLNDADIIGANRVEYQKFIENLLKLKIPLDLLKGNKFVDISGQISMVESLRVNGNLDKYFFSTQIPDKGILENILSIIYDLLFTEGNKGGSFSGEIGKKNLLNLTKYYVYLTPSFPVLLNSDTVKFLRKTENSRIRFTFDLITKYFEFMWPRYIKAFESIFNFVANEKKSKEISLDYIVSLLEYGTNDSHEIILRDAGIPREIMKKISSVFYNCENHQDIQNTFKSRRLEIIKKLSNIELRILDKYI
ncbi:MULTISPECIES: DEAD/DEAH box helicase [Rahnella]|uniref:DEAD/DEAH box helicase n=1 Tax=Rahnella laticis TaxID=2787622 RepID=A0ABS0EC53_9GAMM|nr:MULTISPECIES: DEAD/DEAH box helicase [Rahnella]MBF7982652.1 DEAD/DEAH box helicase [Rahnella laticis]MBF8002845.1 DEAD/DEAH box helicase [Rahnella sp. LAC-M12]